MIAYTNNDDGTINVLGGSDKREILEKLFKGQDFLISENEPVMANGKTYLTKEDLKYQEAKAIEEKNKALADLDAQYISDKSTLQGYYVDFLMAGDNESAQSIIDELNEVTTQYDNDLKEINKGE